MAIKETVEIEVESNATEASQEFVDSVKELTAAVKEFGNSSKNETSVGTITIPGNHSSHIAIIKINPIFKLLKSLWRLFR